MKPTLLTAAAVLSLLLASCTSGTEGIFASIEREQKITSLGGLNTNATVTHMAEFGGKYYAAGGKALFSRSVSATTWTASTVNGSGNVAAVGTTSSLLYAVAGGTLYSSPDGSIWTSVALTSGDTAYDLVPIVDSTGNTSTELLLVADTAGAKDNVYRLTGGIAPLLLNVGTNLAAPVVAAVDTGSNYYLVSENYLWHVPTGFGSNTVVAASGRPTNGSSGLLFVGSDLYLATASNATTGGGVYKAAGASGTSVTFTTLASNVQTSLSKPVNFASLFVPTSGYLWVGSGPSTTTEGTGFSQVATASGTFSQIPTSATTDTNNYASTALENEAVSVFFKGSDGVYIGTVAHGLWKWDSTTRKLSQQ